MKKQILKFKKLSQQQRLELNIKHIKTLMTSANKLYVETLIKKTNPHLLK